MNSRSLTHLQDSIRSLGLAIQEGNKEMSLHDMVPMVDALNTLVVIKASHDSI